MPFAIDSFENAISDEGFSIRDMLTTCYVK